MGKPPTSLALCAVLAGLASPVPVAEPARAMPDAGALRRLEAQYAPVDLRVDLTGLPASERLALAKLVEAARIMDALFLRQVWSGNDELLLRLLEDATPLGQARLVYFLRNKGPWDRLDHMRPFVPGVPEKPLAADFYPVGATREEVQRYLASLPEAERERASGFFTALRRDPAGRIAAVPYSVEYQGSLARAAALLREAARMSQAPTLRAFLEKRAEAFVTNDYYASDLAWMELDAALEPTIGPYEGYEDGWFSTKAAFEAFVCVRDEAETRKLARFSAELQDVEDHLPIAPEYRNPRLGALAPIRVVNEVFASGDANRGIATAAFNLPNDERIVQEKGSKRVMLKNVQLAKFEKILLPIAQVVLSPEDRRAVAFDSFFTPILVHELMHGLGPHRIAVAGRSTTVRQELQESYSAIEEAKADVAGLFALQRFIDRGLVERSMERTLYPTYLASIFRSIRFGLAEAHGSGSALQLNWFLDRRAVVPRKDGTFAVDVPRMKEAVVALTRELMTLQARGDAGGTRELLRRLAVVRPELEGALGRLRDVPVDIAPRFVTADELTR
jgi:Peptidase family M49